MIGVSDILVSSRRRTQAIAPGPCCYSEYCSGDADAHEAFQKLPVHGRTSTRSDRGMEPVDDTFVSTALLAVKRQLLEISGAATSPQQPYRSGAKRFILTTRTLAASPSADQAAFPFQPQPLPAGSDEAACAATASEARMRAAARVSPNMDIGGILNGFDLGDD